MPCPYGRALCWGWESRLGAAGGHGMVVSALCTTGTSSIAFKRAFPPLAGGRAARLGQLWAGEGAVKRSSKRTHSKQKAREARGCAAACSC